MNDKRNIFWFLPCCLLLCLGCDPAPPQELGELHPLKITVVDGDAPLEGVRVSLVKKDSTETWGCGGTTSKNGTVNMTTSTTTFSGKGVPPGTYTIMLGKTPPLPPELESQPEEDSLPNKEFDALQKKRKEFLEKNRIIPKKLEAAKTSPLEVIIGNDSQKTLTVDISQYRSP